MTYAFRVNKTEKSVEEEGYIYHGNLPRVTEFGRDGWLWRVFGFFRKLLYRGAKLSPAPLQTTALVMQASPRVLERIARELYGAKVDGESVEITIVAATRNKPCQMESV